jgi:hypothetical protein
MIRSRRPSRPRDLSRRVVALIAATVALHLVLQAAGMAYLVTHCADLVGQTDRFLSGATNASSALPRDDPRIVLPRQPPAAVDPALTRAGYQCLTETTNPMRIVGCYRYSGGDWSDIRYRVKHGRIVGFTLDGGSYDNGDGREFRQQAGLIAGVALDPRSARQVADGVRRAIERNGPVAVDTSSTQDWSGTAEADADHWGNEYSVRINSAADRDGVLPRPRSLPARAKWAQRQLTDLGYVCEVHGSSRDCGDGFSAEESSNVITVVSDHSGISRLEISYQDQSALADFIDLLSRADPDDAALLTAAVLRTNDGAAHHLVLNGLMVAADVGSVAVYGIDWQI